MNSDVEAPILVSIESSTALLDINSGATSLVVTARFTDDLSGIYDRTLATGVGRSPPQIVFESPSGQQVIGMFDIQNPVSGDRLDGVFRATVTLGPFSEAGTWKVRSVLLNDQANNVVSLTPASSPALADLSFEVLNDDTDITLPVLQSISLSDTLVDIGANETTVLVTARLTDDVSGIFDGIFANGMSHSPPQITFVSPSGQRVTGMFDILHPISGDRLDGVFRAAVNLGPHAQAGTWKVESILINDEAGNAISLMGNRAPNLNFQVVNSKADTAAPTVRWLNIGQPTTNPDGTFSVQITAHFVDTGSGLFDGIFSNGMGHSPPQIMFRSSSGQVAYGMFDIEHPVSGNRTDGVFVANVKLGSFAENGRWNVMSLLVNDEAGNSVSLMPHNSSLVTGASFLLGSETSDTMTGTTSDDVVYGFNGDDQITSGSGNDVVDAGGGNDLIVGGNGAGNDTYIGGSGIDTIRYTSATAGIIIDLTAASNQAKSRSTDAGIGIDQISGVENVIAGHHNDVVVGSAADNIIVGGGGDDVIVGGGGSDTAVFSGNFSSYSAVRTGDSVVITSVAEGQDTFSGVEYFTFANSTVSLAALTGTLSATPPKVTTSSSYTLTTGILELKALGSANIRLTGNGSDNAITGNRGKNTMKGEAGNDKLAGGLGNDTLTGGSGKDAFIFNSKPNKKSNLDQITDFKTVHDSVWLDNAVFRKIGSKGTADHPVKMNKAFFTTGDKAKDKNDFIIYNKKTGVLSYDADGTGAGAAVEIASLRTKASLTYKDFFVI
jgi:Ca2+-binding RTX toxin-like protein